MQSWFVFHITTVTGCVNELAGFISHPKKKKNMYKEQFISFLPDVTAANRFMIVTD